MDKIQEAFNKWLGLPDTDEERELEKRYSHPDLRVAALGFYGGYKVGQDSLKCCGCCKWYTEVRNVYACNNRDSGQWDKYPKMDFICDHWEARE